MDIVIGNDADSIQQLLVMLFLDVEITDMNFNMRSVLFFEQSADQGVSNLFIYGTAKLQQNKPIIYSYFPNK